MILGLNDSDLSEKCILQFASNKKKLLVNLKSPPVLLMMVVIITAGCYSEKGQPENTALKLKMLKLGLKWLKSCKVQFSNCKLRQKLCHYSRILTFFQCGNLT